jgi:hypothetical protein
MLRSLSRIEDFEVGARHLPVNSANTFARNVGGRSIVDRVNAIQGFQNPQIFTGGGSVTLRGPGRNSFLVRNGFAVNCKNFENTMAYRNNSTFEKVYPVCGTAGYFSLHLATTPALYLIAKDSTVIISDISTIVDVQNAACWQTLPGPCTEMGSVILTNKAYPGLALTIRSDTEIVMEAPGVDQSKFCLMEERGLNTYTNVPDPRPAVFSDYDIRQGWPLADLNRAFGPKEFRSHELSPTTARTVEECAAKASAIKDANGFIFLPQGSYDGKNCKIKAGGFWPTLRSEDPNWRTTISGKLKVDIANSYRDPISDFDIRRGWGIRNMNIAYGPNPSYEEHQTVTRTPEACAAAALRHPKANSFLFVPSSDKPCRMFVGGFWTEKQDPIHASFVGGILRSQAPESFDYRPGELIYNENRAYGNNPSYELKEVEAYSPENCAEIALKNDKVNGFVYLPKRFSPGKGNCRQFIGGRWGPVTNEGQRVFTAGMKKTMQ